MGERRGERKRREEREREERKRREGQKFLTCTFPLTLTVKDSICCQSVVAPNECGGRVIRTAISITVSGGKRLGKRPITLNCIEVADNDYNLHSALLHKDCLVMIVCNMNRPANDSNLPSWLQKVAEHTTDKDRLFVVGTHWDLRGEDKKYASHYATVVHRICKLKTRSFASFVPVSSSNPQCFASIRKVVQKCIGGLKWFKSKFEVTMSYYAVSNMLQTLCLVCPCYFSLPLSFSCFSTSLTSCFSPSFLFLLSLPSTFLCSAPSPPPQFFLI